MLKAVNRMSNLPEKFTIPKERIPKAFAQGPYNDCVAITLTKILEVFNYVRTGKYTYLSKGYMYGRNNRPGKTQGGSDYEYMLNKLLMRGTVPEELCPERDEIPEIVKKLEAREDIAELDKIAEEYKILSWKKIPGDIHKLENIKKFLYENQLPLAGNMTGNTQHCTVIVGYDGDKLIYQDHDATGRLISIRHNKFNCAYYVNGVYGGFDKEENEVEFKLMNTDEFKKHIESLKVTRKIKLIQLHHTYSPSYKDFDGQNHLTIQKNIRDYHVIINGWADIGQQFTIFPDGKICTGRDVNTAPAGIYGANSGGICVECLGNFDKGGDTMTDAQKNAIAAVCRVLLDKFNLNAADNVTYHAWWANDGREIGDYVKGASVKSCPGTNFFGGNTLTAYRDNLQPLIENYGKAEKIMLETGNDIVWELMNGRYKIEITEVDRAIKAIDAAKKNANYSSLYWILYKLVNKL